MRPKGQDCRCVAVIDDPLQTLVRGLALLLLWFLLLTGSPKTCSFTQPGLSPSSSQIPISAALRGWG